MEAIGSERTRQALGKLLVCSNRGPVSYERRAGVARPRPAGPGGLVPLVKPALDHYGGDWLFAASSDGDHDVAVSSPEGILQGRVVHRILALPPRTRRDHYETISNDLLKPLFHSLLDRRDLPRWDDRLDSAWSSYRSVNRAYARAVVSKPLRAPIMIQDYHLMLVGKQVRSIASRPPSSLHYFHHVPWCEPDAFLVLPTHIGAQVLEGLLAHDTVGFHTARWADAFLRCCERFLPGAARAAEGVEWRGRTIRVLAVPGGIDARSCRLAARSAEAEEWCTEFRARRLGRWTLVRVDRLDLWKNVLRGFLAFEHLLARRPELAARIWFLALLTVPSTPSQATERQIESCLTAVRRVNERFRAAAGGADAITALVNRDPAGDDRARSLAGMRIADAALVNPLLDGMNLVAKEVCVTSERDPLLILSRNAGAFEELGSAAVAVDPLDVPATAAAIERAFEMPPRERRARADELRRAAEGNPPLRWVERQLVEVGS